MNNTNIARRSQILEVFSQRHGGQNLEHVDKLAAYNSITNFIRKELITAKSSALEQHAIINSVKLALKKIQENVNHHNQNELPNWDIYGKYDTKLLSRLLSDELKNLLEIICCHRKAFWGDRKLSLWKTNYTNTAQDLRNWLLAPRLETAEPTTWKSSIAGLLNVTKIDEINCRSLNLLVDTRIPELSEEETKLTLAIINNAKRIKTNKFTYPSDWRTFVAQSSQEAIMNYMRPGKLENPVLISQEAFDNDVGLSEAEITLLKPLNFGSFSFSDQFSGIGYQQDELGHVEFKCIHPVITYLILIYRPEPAESANCSELYQTALERYEHYLSNKAKIDQILTRIYTCYNTLLIGNAVGESCRNNPMQLKPKST